MNSVKGCSFGGVSEPVFKTASGNIRTKNTPTVKMVGGLRIMPTGKISTQFSVLNCSEPPTA